jgi:hypothetical protein
MNYQAFTDQSLTMMYEAIRGGLNADHAMKGTIANPRSAAARPPSGNSTPAISKKGNAQARDDLRHL